jgi:hypothetical protein
MVGVFLRTYLVHSTYVFLCTRATKVIFNFIATTGRRQKYLRGISMFQFLRRIRMGDDSACMWLVVRARESFAGLP